MLGGVIRRPYCFFAALADFRFFTCLFGGGSSEPKPKPEKIEEIGADVLTPE